MNEKDIWKVWDWGPGVALYGMVDGYKKTGDQKTFNFIKGYIDEWMTRGFPKKNINTTAPMSTVLEIYKICGEEKYLNLIQEYADWLLLEATRVKPGAYAHTVIGHEFSQQIWADTIFMAAIFLSKFGALTGEKKYIDEAVKQLILHIKYLQDPATGLFYHAWDVDNDNAMSAALWGRANGWCIVSAVDILENLSEYREEVQYVKDAFNRQLEKLEQIQRRSGAWNIILDRSDSYLETSTTALFTHGFFKGIKMGWFDEKYINMINKARKSVLNNIAADGEVLKVSCGTPVMLTIDAYIDLGYDKIMPWGQGTALLMLGDERD